MKHLLQSARHMELKFSYTKLVRGIVKYDANTVYDNSFRNFVKLFDMKMTEVDSYQLCAGSSRNAESLPSFPKNDC